MAAVDLEEDMGVDILAVNPGASVHLCDIEVGLR